MGKLNVYSLGEKGVNTSKSPVHLEDGELTTAQNWHPDPEGAIRSRDGLTKLNSSALAGTVTGMVGVPLPDRSALTSRLYVAIDDDVTNTHALDAFRTSTNGTSWSTVATSSIPKPQEGERLGTFNNAGVFSAALRWASLNNKMYYPGNDYVSTSDGGTATTPTIHVWDGTTDYILCEIPDSPYYNGDVDGNGVLAMVPYSDTQLIVSTYDGDGATGATRAMLLDVTTGQLTHLGPETDIVGAAIGIVQYLGKIWIANAASNGTAATIRSCRVGDATWTTELTFDASENGVSLAVFKGNLYCGTSAGWAGGANSSVIKKRTASTAAWTDVLTNDGTGSGNMLGPLIVSADGETLFTFWRSVSGGAAPTERISSTTNGSSWSTAYNVTTGTGVTITAPGFPYIFTDDAIYWPVMESDKTGRILKRTSGGTWSIVEDNGFLLRGPITSIKF